MKVELRIYLPDDAITTVTVLRCHRTEEVFKVKTINLEHCRMIRKL